MSLMLNNEMNVSYAMNVTYEKSVERSALNDQICTNEIRYEKAASF